MPTGIPISYQDNLESYHIPEEIVVYSTYLTHRYLFEMLIIFSHMCVFFGK